MILEKGNSPVVRNLYTIQLIEADLQLLMRILVNKRNRFKIEEDSRVSKVNYGLRLYYSMENAILEKRLVHDNSVL